MIITKETLFAFKPEIRRKFNQQKLPIINPDFRLFAALKYIPKRPPHKSRDKPGFIYFIQCNEFTKIGMARNPQSRLFELCCSSPYDLTLIRSVSTPSMRYTELALHKHFQSFHHTREWFLFPPNVLDHIKSLTDDQINEMGFQQSISKTSDYLNTQKLPENALV